MVTDSQKSIIYLFFTLFFSCAYIVNPASLSLLLYPHFAPAHSLSLMLSGIIGPGIIVALLLGSVVYGFERLSEKVDAMYFVNLALIIFGLLGFCAASYRLWHF